MPKLHEIWPGNNRFFCRICITGPGRDWPGMVFIYTVTITLVTLFSIFIASKNWEVSPILPISFYVLIILKQTFLLLAACTDPGIIPRLPFLNFGKRQIATRLSTAQQKKSNFCDTCQIVRPDRASHCSRCQNCVEIFDHHCGIIGNCIGRRNYRFFIIFLITMFFSLALFIVNMAVFLANKFSQNFDSIVIIIILSLIGAFLGIPLLVFLGFHIYLVCTGATTREVIKKISSDSQEKEGHWCHVRGPNIDFFQNITQEEANQLKQRIQEMRNPIYIGNTLDPLPIT